MTADRIQVEPAAVEAPVSLERQGSVDFSQAWHGGCSRMELESVRSRRRPTRNEEVDVLIRELTAEECRRALSEATFGRLGCCRAGQAYVVPINFVFDGEHAYSASIIGQKIEWMRENPLVCLEVDDVRAPDDWMSLIGLGRFEELSSASPRSSDVERALQLLRSRAMWWQPGLAQVASETASSERGAVFFRVSIESLSGRRAGPADTGA